VCHVPIRDEGALGHDTVAHLFFLWRDTRISADHAPVKQKENTLTTSPRSYTVPQPGWDYDYDYEYNYDYDHDYDYDYDYEHDYDDDDDYKDDGNDGDDDDDADADADAADDYDTSI
jgi:hypothetical protein